MGTISQVIYGAPVLYIETPASTGAGYALQGYTQEGINLTYTPTPAFINVHEETFPIGSVIEAEEMTISGVFAESTLAVLGLACAGAAVAGTTATFGAGTEIKIRVKLVTIDPEDATKFRKYELFRCAKTGAVDLLSSRKEMMGVPFTFSALKDSSEAAAAKITKSLATVDA